MMRVLILILCFGWSISLFSQIGMGQWRMHVSPDKAIDMVPVGNTLYILLEKGLFEYDIESGEQTLWTAADYLSDVTPSAIAYDNDSKSLLIGYANGNIDLIKNETVFNLPFLLKSSVQGIKRINRIEVNDGLAYLSTGVGIVVLDISKKEVKDTYHPTNDAVEFLDLTFYQDRIYTITSEHVYFGNITNAFLADPSQWTQMSSIPDYSAIGRYLEIESFNENLFLTFKNDAFWGKDTLFHIVNDIPEIFDAGKDYYRINGAGEELLVNAFDGLYIFNQQLAQKNVLYKYGDNITPRPRSASLINGKYYIVDERMGIIRTPDNFMHEKISFEGPRYNTAYRLDWNKDKLAIACGGTSGTGPKFSQDGGAFFDDNKWTSLPIRDNVVFEGDNIWDFISVSINPKNKEEVAYGTLSEVPIVLTKNGEVTNTFGLSNSIIEEVGSTGWGYISDLNYDEKGNLWVANSLAEKPLKVLSNEGVWYDFNLGNGLAQETTKRLTIDHNDVKWLTTKSGGVIAFSEGKEIADASDDQYKKFNSGKNSGDLPSNNVEAIAVDINNNIWVGTPEGMRVLYNTSAIFDASPGAYNFQKLLIQYGENVEIVLGTTHITCIKVDGGNRKWIGTASSGVFLISADGLEVERTFTTENSPLLSNTIYDITVDQTTGEVYFATQEGMISYRSDASQGDIDYTNVIVFPNPVRPNYYGPITIQGIAYDSDVRITDISGKLVYKTKSQGGTATWSGNTMDGNRAATGVYLIWTAIDDHEFKGKKVGKVLLIN